jgi:lyso-ornithine lipid O-acyltransferase
MLDYGAVGPDISWLGLESGLNNALRVLSRRGSFPLHIHFLDPFWPHEFDGRKAIAAESQRRISAALETAIGDPVVEFVGHDHWANGAGAL